MIAKVRIAPKEHWCEALLKDLEKLPEMKNMVGSIVEIETKSLTTHQQRHRVEVKWWNLTPESRDKLLDQLGGEYRLHAPKSTLVCEHLLEMD